MKEKINYGEILRRINIHFEVIEKWTNLAEKKLMIWDLTMTLTWSTRNISNRSFSEISQRTIRNK
jgi:hypothetical protein